MCRANRRIQGVAKYDETLRRARHFMPFRIWPVRFFHIFFRGTTLTYSERFGMACFLLGNGVCREDAWTLLEHRLRDKAAKMHMRSLFSTIMRGDRDHTWTYYNVGERDVLTLAGVPCGEPRDLAAVTRPINAESRRAWQSFCRTK